MPTKNSPIRGVRSCRRGLCLTVVTLAHAWALLGGRAEAQVDLDVELENADADARGLEAVDPDLRYLYQPPPPPTPFPRRLRWARAMLPAGAILLATGAVQLAAFARNRCAESDGPRMARWSGGLLAGVGLGLTVAGVFSLRSVSRRVRSEHAIPKRRQRGAVSAIAGAFLHVFMPTIAMGLFERVFC